MKETLTTNMALPLCILTRDHGRLSFLRQAPSQLLCACGVIDRRELKTQRTPFQVANETSKLIECSRDEGLDLE